jgi:septal ring factor EnvC (AmiA/AmiB activator)
MTKYLRENSLGSSTTMPRRYENVLRRALRNRPEQGKRNDMKITFLHSFVVAALLSGALVCLPTSRAAEARAAAPKDAQSMIVEMRLKNWNKNLQLTEDQQAKIKALLTDESKQIAKLDEDNSLPIGERANKIDELHKMTYEKIKPLLTETQTPVFEKLTTRKPKKSAAPAKP